MVVVGGSIPLAPTRSPTHSWSESSASAAKAGGCRCRPRRFGVEPHHDALKLWLRCPVELHHQRIVTRNNVIRRGGQSLEDAKRIDHLAQVQADSERPVTCHILEEVRR